MARPKGSKNKPKDVQQNQQAPVTDENSQSLEASPAVEDTPKVPLKPHYQDRYAKLKELHESHQERNAARAEEDGDPEDIEIDVSEDTEEETELEAPLETPPPEQLAPVAKRKFVVDGKEVELTEEQIIARIQKSEAADARLAEANRILEDAKRQAATQGNPKASGQPSPAPSSAEDVDDSEVVTHLTKAVLYGDEEQVRNAFAQVLGNGRQKATQDKLSPQQIQAYVTETLAFERGKQLLESTPEQGGYSDVWNDPVLKLRFQQREQEMREGGDNRPYAELYKSIGEEVRGWRENLIKQYMPKTGLEDRDALKRKTGVVRGAGGKLPTAQIESKPKSREDVLNGMRAARGQH